MIFFLARLVALKNSKHFLDGKCFFHPEKTGASGPLSAVMLKIFNWQIEDTWYFSRLFFSLLHFL